MNENDLRISEVKVRLSNKSKAGLYGWASCVLNEAFLLNNIAIRKSLDGKFVLSFPAYHTKNNVPYHYFKPISQEAFKTLTDAIVRELESLGNKIGE